MRAALGALAALAVGLAVAAGGCGGGSVAKTQAAASTEGHTAAAGSTTVEPAAAKGGIYRIGVEGGFPFTDGFDPTGEYLSEAWGLYSNLLIRTLLGYRHVAGPPGNELIPDLAAAQPRISDGGLTWRFRLKNGVRFGPPVSREITSHDVAYAFERIGTPALAAGYGNYYDVIVGMDAYRQGKASHIAGIETPDSKTIVFHLTQPTGDFGYRLAMPAAGPIPREVAHCFTKAGDYGRDLVSSGPYMIEGSDKVDISSCATIDPIAGFDPDASLSLVRNPDYDPATDTTAARQNLPNGFLLTVDTNGSDIFAKLGAGELDGEWATAPPKVLKEYSENPDLRDRLKVGRGDAIAYLTMNLTQPPFDDVHVRKAVSLAIDKAGLQKAWGGPLVGKIATHLLPDAMLDDKLVGFDPYPGPDLAAAKAEMAKSRYDSNHDGVCDAPACNGVFTLSTNHDTVRRMEPVVEQSLAPLGITLTVRELSNPFPALQTPRKDIPFTLVVTWSKDYADPSTYMVLFDGANIAPEGNVNVSLVGLTPAKAKAVGAQGSVDGVPSVDAGIDACKRLLGNERLDCWAALDRRLMEDVVPAVPYLDENNVDVLGPAVTQYEYDQFPGVTAYAHVAVDPAKQRS